MSFNKLKHLAMVLENVKPNPHPKVELEQYSLGGDVASRIIWFAGKVNDDICGKFVLDLGCGSGILAIGAALLGADFVLGLDFDFDVLKVALDNAKLMNVSSKTSFICVDISNIYLRNNVDTVIQNPPFGVHRRGADRVFLKKALEISNVVYSIHKYSFENHIFLSKFISSLGGVITHVMPFTLSIPHTFDFHRELKRKVNVVLYRIMHV